MKQGMSRDKPMTLRVQSPEGTKRLEVSPSETTCQLFERVHNTFNLLSFAFALYQEKNNKEEITSSKSRTIRSLGLRHGDMLYMAPLSGSIEVFPVDTTTIVAQAGEPGFVSTDTNNFAIASTSSGVGASTSSVASTSRPNSSRPNTARTGATVVEDDVDLALFKLDGKIDRKRDDKLCRHNSNARCFHCSALEPYDEAYLKEQNIKHLSFHSYLRKMTSGVDKGKFLALEDIRCRIKGGCKDHPPWPRGICSKCQPNAVTLNRQIYRHIDNVTFENPSLVERFLNYWRITGHQRIGFLYGTYEVHADVPLGVRATVAAIYEPPQESGRDSVRLLEHDERQGMVDDVATELGLKKVGWIFTDLLPEDVQKGTVRHTRHAQTHFLSAQECIMAGHFQNENRNACRWASDGTFGSKFVTVCVTGDKTNQVHMEGYQVSNQCMALVRDNCLVPTRDAPELGYIRESSDKQYVPDVYYKEKDSYGNEVSRLARPLPVEYLLLDVPASTPLAPAHTFNPLGPDRAQFPVENRLLEGHLQDFASLADYMGQFNGPEEFLSAMSDFHLLLYVATMDTLPLREHMAPLLEAVRTKGLAAAQLWATSEHWATVEQLIAASSPPNSRPGSTVGGALRHQPHFPAPHSGNAGNTGNTGAPMQQDAANHDAHQHQHQHQQWTCAFCTFLNQPTVANCEMCNLPRSGNASH